MPSEYVNGTRGGERSEGRGRGVVDPEAEGERARLPPRWRVEDEVVDAGVRQHGPDHGLRPAERLVRVEVRRDPGVADDAVLVVVRDDARGDADASRVPEDHRAEVRDPSPERELEDLLGSSEPRR